MRRLICGRVRGLNMGLFEICKWIVVKRVVNSWEVRMWKDWMY